jgi:hypothetical protein
MVEWDGASSRAEAQWVTAAAKWKEKQKSKVSKSPNLLFIFLVS